MSERGHGVSDWLLQPRFSAAHAIGFVIGLVLFGIVR